MSYQTHEAAWKARITDVTTHPTLDNSEAATTPMFVRISVTRAVREEPWACGRRRSLGWRLETLSVGTDRSEVQWLRDRLLRLLDEPLPAIDAGSLAPDGDADEPEEGDGGDWTAVDSFIYFAPNPTH